METTVITSNDRQLRRYARFRQKTLAEFELERNALQARPDYREEYSYFLDLASTPFQIADVAKRVNKPVIGLFCIQAPLELFLAFGIHPVRLCGGSQTVQQAAASSLPVLTCPMLKSFMGSFALYQNRFQDFKGMVLPTTCDWIVKLPEIMGINGETLHYMELPHVKDTEKSQKRWLEEVYDLKHFLEKLTKHKLHPDDLIHAIQRTGKIWSLLKKLEKFKSDGILSEVWFLLITNSFLLDTPEKWLTEVEKIVNKLQTETFGAAAPKVFLAGSPVIFPNYKLPELIEQAGMWVTADDLCSSERILPGGIVYDDPSEYGILRALSERYHKACICPTFTENERRVNNIINSAEDHQVKGVVYNLLKGCHPYDIEAITIEQKLKEHGLKFIKIETDYGREDSQNILTRLEAFRHTL